MVSDCAREFSWCATNQKFPKFENDLILNDGGKCIAVQIKTTFLKSFKCTERLYFVCEVSIS